VCVYTTMSEAPTRSAARTALLAMDSSLLRGGAERREGQVDGVLAYML
jgi:hypothetical protein